MYVNAHLFDIHWHLTPGLLLIILMSSLLPVCTLMVQCNTVASAATADDWPMLRHDAQHSGYSASKAPNTNHTLWSSKINAGHSSPAVVEGKVYIGSMDGKLHCLDAASGAYIWNYTTGSSMLGRAIYSSPAVADGKVYVGSSAYRIYCLNSLNGALVWSSSTGGRIESSPVVVGGLVYVGSQDGKVYCLNAANGAYLWRYITADWVQSSPAIADGKLYVCSNDYKVYCIGATTGALIWNYTTGRFVPGSPAVADGKVYIGSTDGKVYCLNAADGTLIWNYTTGGVMYSPAIADGKLYIGSANNKIYCLDAATGASIWNYATSDIIYSSPAVADGKLYIGSQDNKLYCLNASSGTLIWSYTTGGYVSSSPAVADGKVYVGSYDGKVYAFGSPQPCNLNSLFTLNNVQMIYPSDQTPKPLGCVAAMVTDWTASALIYSKLSTVTEGVDTDPAFVNQVTGKPTGAAGTGIVSFGGPIVNPIIAYAENGATPTVDRAPIRYYSNAGVLHFQHANGTDITGANMPFSVIGPGGPNNMDMFLIEVYQDGDGRFIMLCYGFGWKGTYAAGKYFDTEIYPNLASCNYAWTIVKWEDTNANGFVNTATDGDTYTVIATG